MDERSHNDLQLLLEKKWDPVRGVGKTLGKIRAFCVTLFMISIFVSCLVPYVAGLYYIMAIPLIICAIQPALTARRTQARAKKHGWFLCPWCRYTLTGLDDTGTCPECGNPYEKQACVVLFESAYRGYKPDPNILKQRESKAWKRMIELRDGSIDSSTNEPQRGSGL